MGRQAEVLSTKRETTEDGVPVVDVECDPHGGKPLTAQLFQPPGVDAPPLPGDFVHLAEGEGTGNYEAVGFHDTKNEGKAADGEFRSYARAPDGAIVSEIWLKGDGSGFLHGLLAGWKFEFNVDGSVAINGVTFSKQGAITAPLEITAMAATPATAVTVSKHLHPSAVGPTGTPTPGT